MNRLRDLREDKDLKQGEFANLLKINKRTYTDYENENILISADLLCKLADYYKVSTDYLVYNTDERESHKIIKRKQSNRLKELRKEKMLNQSDLANVLSMTQNGYSKYELCQRKLPINILYKLSEYYDTSIDYLLFRTNVKKRYKKSKIRN